MEYRVLESGYSQLLGMFYDDLKTRNHPLLKDLRLKRAVRLPFKTRRVVTEASPAPLGFIPFALFSHSNDTWEDDLTEGPYGCPLVYENREQRKKDESILKIFQPQKDQLTAKMAANMGASLEQVRAMSLASFISTASTFICEVFEGIELTVPWTNDELELMQFLMRQRRVLELDDYHRRVAVTKQMTHLFADLTALVSGSADRLQFRQLQGHDTNMDQWMTLLHPAFEVSKTEFASQLLFEVFRGADS